MTVMKRGSCVQQWSNVLSGPCEENTHVGSETQNVVSISRKSATNGNTSQLEMIHYVPPPLKDPAHFST